MGMAGRAFGLPLVVHSVLYGLNWAIVKFVPASARSALRTGGLYVLCPYYRVLSSSHAGATSWSSTLVMWTTGILTMWTFTPAERADFSRFARFQDPPRL